MTRGGGIPAAAREREAFRAAERSLAGRGPTPSALALIAANLVVAAFCGLGGWGYYEALLVYWLEALVIGAYTVLRMLVVGCAGERPFGGWMGRNAEFGFGARPFFVLLVVGFFVVKFGGLALAAGMLAVAMPAFFAGPAAGEGTAVLRGIGAVGEGVAAAVAALALSHGVSFVRNFLGRREYRDETLGTLMLFPYVRMTLVVPVLAVGAVLAALLPGGAGATAFAVVMVLAKLGVDLLSHVREHERKRPPAADAP